MNTSTQSPGVGRTDGDDHQGSDGEGSQDLSQQRDNDAPPAEEGTASESSTGDDEPTGDDDERDERNFERSGN